MHAFGAEGGLVTSPHPQKGDMLATAVSGLKNV
jgi:hypothetical protein